MVSGVYSLNIILGFLSWLKVYSLIKGVLESLGERFSSDLREQLARDKELQVGSGRPERSRQQAAARLDIGFK